MDELTRERFWPRPLPPILEVEDVVSRQMVLVGYDETHGRSSAIQEVRLRAEALLRSRRLARAIKAYEVKRG